MDIEIKVKITGPDGTAHTEKIATFKKGAETTGEIGPTIAESKDLLLQLQQEVVSAQNMAYCAKHSCCPGCGRKLRCKGRGHIRYRTVFGDVAVPSPRFYHCQCHDGLASTFSPLTELLPDQVAPELIWLELNGLRWRALGSRQTF